MNESTLHVCNADEFATFMKPLMSFSERHEYEVLFTVEQKLVLLAVSPLGMEVVNGDSHQFFNFFSIMDCAVHTETRDSNEIKAVHLTVESDGEAEDCVFVFETQESDKIVSSLAQQQAKLTLRTDIELDKQQRQLREAFARVDTSGDGILQVDEVRRLVDMLGHDLSNQDIINRIEMIDSDGDHQLSYDEFVKWMTDLQDEFCEGAFSLYDKDSNGTISVAELQTLIRSLGEAMPDEQIKQLAKHVDHDGSGMIDVSFRSKQFSLGHRADRDCNVLHVGLAGMVFRSQGPSIC